MTAATTIKSVEEVWDWYNKTSTLYVDLLPSLLRVATTSPAQLASLKLPIPADLIGLTFSDVAALQRELEILTTLAMLTSVEAAFLEDYKHRKAKRLKDSLSKSLRALKLKGGQWISLTEHVLQCWEAAYSVPQLNMLNEWWRVRNWLAHGRHWSLKTGKPVSPEHLYHDLTTLQARLPELPY